MDCRLSGLETMSPIRIIIPGPTRLVLIWDGEVTGDITTHATTGIGDTMASIITAKAIISGTSGAAIRDVIGADEVNVSPEDGPSQHNG